MRTLIGVYGASGCGRGIMPLLSASIQSDETQLVFIDDELAGTKVNGYDVLNWIDYLNYPIEEKKACLAIANSSIRQRLDRKCNKAGIEVIGVSAGNVVTMDEIELAPGALLSAFVTLASNIKIGRCFHANLYSYVEHDCVIGDYVTFAPGVKCNGNVHIEDHAYIGTGAILKQGRPGAPLTIGRGAVVGMGAVVTKDVAQGATVVGNPAKPLVRS